MSTTTHERKNNLETTQQLWSQVVEKHPLTCLKNDYTVNEFTTRLCYLSTDACTARGIGKGQNECEVDISASFEALEYYLAGYCFHEYSITIGSISTLSNQYSLYLNRCDRERFLSSANQHISIPWAIYEDVKTKALHAAPLATVDLRYQSYLLENDHFDYADCAIYAASNGLASGTTYEEAVIHGALELLERDAYSYFLIDTYLLNKSPLEINQQSLPIDLLALVNKIEKNYKNKVLIFQMPSRFGVHAYIATLEERIFGIQPRGAGASLHAKYALERALYELIQTFNLMHGDYIENEINLEQMNGNSLIKQFLEFDFSQKLNNRPNKIIDFYDTAHGVGSLALSDYLLQLIELIDNQSSSLLVNTVYMAPNGVSCTRVIIPEAEEFFLAAHYIKLQPNTKTNLYIASQLGKQFDWKNINNSL